MNIRSFWRALGGRKQSNAYLTALLLTVVVFFVAPESYRYYGAYLLAAMGITNAAIAWEDVRRTRYDDLTSTRLSDFDAHEWADGREDGIL